MTTDNIAYMSSNKNDAIALFNRKTGVNTFRIDCILHIMQFVLNLFEKVPLEIFQILLGFLEFHILTIFCIWLGVYIMDINQVVEISFLTLLLR